MIKNNNSENNDKEKQLGFLDYTPPEYTEEGASDKKMIIVKVMTRKKTWMHRWHLPPYCQEYVSDTKNEKNEKNYEKKNWMPRWHFPWRDGERCKW